MDEKMSLQHRVDCSFIGSVVRRANKVGSEFERRRLKCIAAEHAAACALAWHDDRMNRLALRLSGPVRSVTTAGMWWQQLCLVFLALGFLCLSSDAGAQWFDSGFPGEWDLLGWVDPADPGMGPINTSLLYNGTEVSVVGSYLTGQAAIDWAYNLGAPGWSAMWAGLGIVGYVDPSAPVGGAGGGDVDVASWMAAQFSRVSWGVWMFVSISGLLLVLWVVQRLLATFSGARRR